ncbi:hypothetical protein [Methylobacterium sp. BTF04]|uniref:hypothetical protein n=1 Tax=Methylobacterium sp. BTF04 TaxID=2708300 RepID=UPI001FEE24D6|nr:hypothetical protein [Methylobacterium sp. BTF04]
MSEAGAEVAVKYVTVTMDAAILHRAHVAAPRDGKSLSTFIAEMVERRVGRPLFQRTALDSFLAGPPLHLLDADRRAPIRDQADDDE